MKIQSRIIYGQNILNNNGVKHKYSTRLALLAGISLNLNSPSGQLFSGFAIYGTKRLILSDVSTICTGMAASMGSILLVEEQKGKCSALDRPGGPGVRNGG